MLRPPAAHSRRLYVMLPMCASTGFVFRLGWPRFIRTCWTIISARSVSMDMKSVNASSCPPRTCNIRIRTQIDVRNEGQQVQVFIYTIV